MAESKVERPKSPRRALRKEKIQREILDAAGKLFEEQGYAHVTVRAVADRIGYSQGVIFYYFKDKSEILATLCREAFSALSDSLHTIEQQETTSLGKLLASSRAYIAFGREHPHHYRIVFSPPSKLDGFDSVQFVGDIGRDSFRQLNSLIQKCIQDETFRQVDVNTASHSWWSCMHGLTLFLITHERTPWVQPVQTIDHTLEALCHGLFAKQTGSRRTKQATNRKESIR